MKKLVTSIFGVTLALTLGSMVSFAAVSGCNRHFTDADLDGVCDYCHTACQFTDADEDGICDYCGFDRHGMDTVCRSGYADEDGDGICDNCHTGRHAAGNECSTLYTDADKDGICDICHSSHAAGSGCVFSKAADNSRDTASSGTSVTGHHRSGHGSHHGRSGGHCR